MKGKIARFLSLLTLPVFVVPSPVLGCEPIVPLAQLVLGPVGWSRSFVALALAVSGKTLLFMLLEKRLSKARAALYMVVANILTTLIGILVAMTFAAPFFMLMYIPVLWWLGLTPASRITRLFPNSWLKRLRPGGIATVLVLMLALTVVMFGMAQGAQAQDDYTAYWLYKLAYIYPGLLFSFIITTFWEEWAIARLAKRRMGELDFVMPVVRANLYVALAVLLASSVTVLPERLRSPNFLLSWLEATVRHAFRA